jgi:hypothetical protein
MDAKHFDAITKAWISLPRRRLLGGLVAGTVAPLLGLGTREVRAVVQTCGPNDPACPAGQVCRRNVCVTKCNDPFRCGGGGGGCDGACFCGKLAQEKGNVCVQPIGACTPGSGQAPACRRHSDCERGLCAKSCCGEDEPRYACVLPCDA